MDGGEGAKSGCPGVVVDDDDDDGDTAQVRDVCTYPHWRILILSYSSSCAPIRRVVPEHTRRSTQHPTTATTLDQLE